MGSHIRERIKAARQHAKLSQERLGELIGVSKSAVSMWETTNPKKYTRPTLDNLKLISTYTGAKMDWLLDDGEEINPEWRPPAEIIPIGNPGQVVEMDRYSRAAMDAAEIINSLPPADQDEALRFLRIYAQTKA